uniref:Uncharacterized protein n=1 Tax=Alexandrium monilatum TaxID=311494 RepID=A0A7S4WCU5_9DINO|mmetsp:Transcript_41784/g.130559  ORF Transcript_41784/g.130559 Transcript_41784/m.130559 type:complete len:748 (+) Transcript_41784:48-2291(+)
MAPMPSNPGRPARGHSKKRRDPLEWDEAEDGPMPPEIARALDRIKESLTGTGLRDFSFYATSLIRDTRDNLQDDFPALQHLCFAVAKAALTLDNKNWDRFQELPVVRQHCLDYEMHTAQFSKIEPTWKTLLTSPKGGTTQQVWLHLGTEATSEGLGDLLDKMGWFGMHVCAHPPPPHLRDRVDHIQLDPLRDKDDEQFKFLCRKKGGMMPKPKLFSLVFIKMIFSPDDPTLDSSDEEDEVGMSSIKEEPPEAPEDGGEVRGGASASKPPKKKGPGIHEIGSECFGYGKLGVTRGMHPRRRLRALRNVLNVALTRLDDKGFLVITWPALPFHPMLFFLTHFLRGLFMRVHLITPENIKSWEIYILCAGFKREDKNNPGAGGGSELKSFMEGAYRSNCLDDVLLWTLTSEAEKEEAEGPKGSVAIGYEDLWTVYANKLDLLATELQVEVAAPLPTRKPKAQKAADQAKAKAKAKAAPDSPSSGAGGARAPAVPGREEGREPASASKERPQQQAPGGSKTGAKDEEVPVSLIDSDAKKAARLDRAAKEEKRHMTTDQKAAAAGMSKEDYEAKRFADLQAKAESWTVMENTGIQAFLPKQLPKKTGPISRSYPSLACSLGAAPGASHSGFPDRKAFVAKYPMLAHALDCTEHNDRRWHRRRLVSRTCVVPGNEDGGVTLSEDLVANLLPTPSAPAPATPSSKKIPLWSPPKLHRASPPPLFPLGQTARTGTGRPMRPGYPGGGSMGSLRVA